VCLTNLLRFDALGARRENHPVAHESGQRALVEMLKLAAPAAPEVTARRCGMMRARLHAAVGKHDVTRRSESDVTAVRGHAVALGGDPNYFFRQCHRKRA
jgi:hypothetical protein